MRNGTACLHCRQAHLSCSRTRPCFRCVERGLACVDPPTQVGGRRRKGEQLPMPPPPPPPPPPDQQQHHPHYPHLQQQQQQQQQQQAQAKHGKRSVMDRQGSGSEEKSNTGSPPRKRPLQIPLRGTTLTKEPLSLERIPVSSE